MIFDDDSVGFIGPSSYASLVQNVDDSYTRTFHQNGLQFNFSTGGTFTSEEDQNSNTISFSYDPMITDITDTERWVTHFDYTTVGSQLSLTGIYPPASAVPAVPVR